MNLYCSWGMESRVRAVALKLSKCRNSGVRAGTGVCPHRTGIETLSSEV